MPAHKDQHFVPRCHLRPFSLDGAGDAINLFNFSRRRVIENAPAKDQCSADYFYGKDLIAELGLQPIEGLYAAAVAKLVSPGYDLASEERELLRAFWVLQNLRTDAAARAMAGLSNEMVDTTGAPEEYRMTGEQAVQIALSTLPAMLPGAADLKVCLVRNRTAVEFITSDDPAVYANRWYFNAGNAPLVAPGLQNSGTLCLLPLTPRHLFLAYDGDVYSIPVDAGWLDVRKERDVRLLNEHQLLNARSNVYFQRPAMGEEVAREFEDAAARRIPARYRLNHAVLESDDGTTKLFRQTSAAEAREHQHSIIHSEKLYPRARAWPDFIRWRPGGTAFTSGSGMGYVRRAHADPRAGTFRKVKIDGIRP